LQLSEYLPMKIWTAQLPDVKVIELSVIGDNRGSFSEIYRRDTFAAAGIDIAGKLQPVGPRSAYAAYIRRVAPRAPRAPDRSR